MSQLVTKTARKGRNGVVGLVGLLAIGGLSWVFWPSPNADLLIKRAGEAFMARRFDLAEADLDRVNRLRPPKPIDWMLRGQLLMVKGRVDEALEALDKVPDDYPMAAQARLQAGQIELRRDRFASAEARFREAVRLDPARAIQAHRELIYIHGMQLRRPELNADFQGLSKLTPLDYPQVFLWCLSRGVTWEAAEIVATLKKCLDADPSDRWARLGMAEGLREMSRFDEAEAVLKPLADSDPTAQAARVRLALDRGDDTLAESLLAGRSVDHLDLALLRGRFALARGDASEAVRQFRLAYQKAPNLREAVLGYGQALKASGDEAGAAPLLEEARKHERLGSLIQKAAVEKNRDDLGLIDDLGDACAAIGRFPEARAWYNLAITRDNLDRRGQLGLAQLRELEAKPK